MRGRTAVERHETTPLTHHYLPPARRALSPRGEGDRDRDRGPSPRWEKV